MKRIRPFWTPVKTWILYASKWPDLVLGEPHKSEHFYEKNSPSSETWIFWSAGFRNGLKGPVRRIRVDRFSKVLVKSGLEVQMV